MTTHKADGTWGWINGVETFIPESRRSRLFAGERIAVVAGYAYTVAVLDADGVCIGWMQAADVSTTERPTTNADDEVTRPR